MSLFGSDVLEFLKAQKDDSADLIIADPPYGIDKDYGVSNSWSNIEEWALWCEAWLSECCRVLNASGNLIVYGIHNYLCYNQVSLYKLGMVYRRQFVWHYENGFCGNRSLPRATYEPLLWFSKKSQSFFEEIREPYKSSDRLKYKIVKNGRVWQPNPLGRIVGDVWNIPTLAGRRFRDEKVEHPSQKPLVISERLIRHFSPADGVVIIPFVGSGSECVAAHKLGRKFAGTEVNSKYRAIAASRLRAEGWQADAEPECGYRMF
jgi:site-specific DNA-methyltransferase (adenine-specific)